MVMPLVVLIGARRPGAAHRHGERQLAGLLEMQRQREAGALGQRLVQPDQHDVGPAGCELRGGVPSEIDGGDRVQYRIPLSDGSGSVTFEARLLYQAIGFRWAENLKAYDSPETKRFVGYYEGSAAGSAEQLASAERRISY